jgi:hypothetical protein
VFVTLLPCTPPTKRPQVSASGGRLVGGGDDAAACTAAAPAHSLPSASDAVEDCGIGMGMTSAQPLRALCCGVLGGRRKARCSACCTRARALLWIWPRTLVLVHFGRCWACSGGSCRDESTHSPSNSTPLSHTTQNAGSGFSAPPCHVCVHAVWLRVRDERMGLRVH